MKEKTGWEKSIEKISPVLELLRETYSVAIALFKILIPAIIVVKVLQEIGAVAVLSKVLEPVMSLFGLPGSMAIVWTTAMVTNIYGALAVLMLLIGDTPLSVAQMTVLSTMILICHSLPVELALTHRVGGHFLFLGVLRLFGASLAGGVLWQIYSHYGLLEAQAVVRWSAQKVEGSIWDWCINQVNNLGFILIVLFSLLTLMRFLNYVRFTEFLGKLLRPLLILMGISPKGASIAVFGLLAGITFGSGLLLAEIKKSSIPAKDIVLVLSFLSLCHGMIEDTTLMFLFGAHYSGILVFRVVFAVAVLIIFSRLSFVNFELLQPKSARSGRVNADAELNSSDDAKNGK
ncbi:MAG: hypothetical protein KDD70_00210 [Bdellovibrionales bacterium]|nr:hypothetical protein [Bdellovibrionales bacterium]